MKMVATRMSGGKAISAGAVTIQYGRLPYVGRIRGNPRPGRGDVVAVGPEFGSVYPGWDKEWPWSWAEFIDSLGGNYSEAERITGISRHACRHYYANHGNPRSIRIARNILRKHLHWEDPALPPVREITGGCSLPKGYPTENDSSVERFLKAWGVILHHHTPWSFEEPGHEERMAKHIARVAGEMT